MPADTIELQFANADVPIVCVASSPVRRMSKLFIAVLANAAVPILVFYVFICDAMLLV